MASCVTSHGLSTIAAHIVRRTFPGTAAAHVDLAQFAANDYGSAVDLARAERILPGQYAVIDCTYECGCRGQG